MNIIYCSASVVILLDVCMGFLEFQPMLYVFDNYQLLLVTAGLLQVIIGMLRVLEENYSGHLKQCQYFILITISTTMAYRVFFFSFRFFFFNFMHVDIILLYLQAYKAAGGGYCNL